jgi:hypothetical protein
MLRAPTDAFQSLSHHYAANIEFMQFRVKNISYTITVQKYLENIKHIKYTIWPFLLTTRKQK